MQYLEENLTEATRCIDWLERKYRDLRNLNDDLRYYSDIDSSLELSRGAVKHSGERTKNAWESTEPSYRKCLLHPSRVRTALLHLFAFFSSSRPDTIENAREIIAVLQSNIRMFHKIFEVMARTQSTNFGVTEGLVIDRYRKENASLVRDLSALTPGSRRLSQQEIEKKRNDGTLLCRTIHDTLMGGRMVGQVTYGVCSPPADVAELVNARIVVEDVGVKGNPCAIDFTLATIIDITRLLHTVHDGKPVSTKVDCHQWLTSNLS